MEWGGGVSFGAEAATWRARNEHICSTLLGIRVCVCVCECVSFEGKFMQVIFTL